MALQQDTLKCPTTMANRSGRDFVIVHWSCCFQLVDSTAWQMKEVTLVGKITSTGLSASAAREVSFGSG